MGPWNKTTRNVKRGTTRIPQRKIPKKISPIGGGGTQGGVTFMGGPRSAKVAKLKPRIKK